jgi:hypothetical protein
MQDSCQSNHQYLLYPERLSECRLRRAKQTPAGWIVERLDTRFDKCRTLRHLAKRFAFYRVEDDINFEIAYSIFFPPRVHAFL